MKGLEKKVKIISSNDNFEIDLEVLEKQIKEDISNNLTPIFTVGTIGFILFNFRNYFINCYR
jgi:hypothetical protein